MKKLFTLIALLTCFLGASAVEITDFTLDYTEKGKSTIGWKADMIQDDWITADEDGLHLYNPEVTENFYDYQLWIFSGANLELGLNYTVKIVAKVNNGSADVRCRIGDWDGGIANTITVNSTDYQEYTFTGDATVASNGLLVQFGDYVGTVSFKSVTITHEGKEQRPTVWQEWLTSDGQPRIVETTFDKVEGYMGNAETPWADPNVRWNDESQNYLICAWGKEKGVNLNEEGGWDPFPATIEQEGDNHYFICHGKTADTAGDASAWDNQFWIQSPRAWKSGEQVKVHFRYKASAPVSSTDTQIHYQNPSNYLIWHAIGNIAFTTEWQDFDGTMTIADDMAGGWSIAFNLNTVVKDAVDFYFDDLSWQSMKLDEGFFVAASNTKTGIEYDFDSATEFTYDEGEELYTATVGVVGKQDTWVNELMISTIRGNDGAFKGATLKPTNGTITGEDPDEWLNYTEGSLAKIKLPAAGVWRITIDAVNKQMLFEKLEGETNADPIDVVTNTTEIVVKGQERDWKGAKDDGTPQDGEDGIGTGQAWDNQFWLVANRTLAPGEVTVLTFKYKASLEAKTTTQCHNLAGQYIHWAAIGDVNFTTEWQDFSTEFTVPSQCDGSDNAGGYKNDFKSVAFNMAEIKAACDYEIKDVQWYLKGDGLAEGKTWENLINAEGTENFWVKEGAGTDPYQYGGGTGISNVVNNKQNGSAVIYNLAGQKVNKDYKGLVIKSGKKFVVK